MITPIILSGGSGERLWPLSRKTYPKQLINLYNNQTLLQNTALLSGKVKNVTQPIIVCNKEHQFIVADQLREINIEPLAIIIEPEGKSTAPAITLSMLYAQSKDLKNTFIVLPSDHLIKDPDSFAETISQAAEGIANDLVIFGVMPTAPETGYGYIKASQQKNDIGAYEVDHFHEKPDLEIAKSYIEKGDFYWNSGMFMFTSDTFFSEMKKHAPEVLTICQNAFKGSQTKSFFIEIDKQIFNECPVISFDHAVMEKTHNAVIFPLSHSWSDVGNWNSLWGISEKSDDCNNVALGDVISIETKNSYLRSESRLLATIGVDNLIVVETPDVVLVVDRSEANKVKNVVNQLNESTRLESKEHKSVYKPWGYYQIIDKSDTFQVKRLCLNPGAAISLQLHHHRSEHWVVVKGTAEVTLGEEITILHENKSVFIPTHTKHRLRNTEDAPLHVIEVQVGSYLSEDDIIRFEDIYNSTAA